MSGGGIRGTWCPSYRAAGDAFEITADAFLQALERNAATVAPSEAKDTLCVVSASFRGKLRRRSEITALHGLAFDVDCDPGNGASYPRHPRHHFEALGVQAFAWTTQSHGLEAKGSDETHPRFRGLIPFAESVTGEPEHLNAIHCALLAHWLPAWGFEGLDVRTVEQAQLMPVQRHPDARCAPWIVQIAGDGLDLERLPLPSGGTIAIGELLAREAAARGVQALPVDEAERARRRAAWDAADASVRAAGARSAVARMRELCAGLEGAPSGERTDTMFRAALQLGRYAGAGVLTDEQVDGWCVRLDDAARVAFAGEYESTGAPGQIANGVRLGRNAPIPVQAFRGIADPHATAPLVSLDEARALAMTGVRAGLERGALGLHVLAVPPAVGKSHATATAAAQWLADGAGRPAGVVAVPTHAKALETVRAIRDAVDALDLPERDRRRLEARIVLDLGRSSDPDAPSYCAEHATWSALFRAAPPHAERFCVQCPHRATCPFVQASGAARDPERMRGRIIVRTHERHARIARRMTPGAATVDYRQALELWGYASGGEYDDSQRWCVRVQFTRSGGQRVTVEPAPFQGVPMPELLEGEDYNGRDVTDAGRDAIRRWLAEWRGMDCGTDPAEIAQRHNGHPWPHSFVVFDESPWGACEQAYQIKAGQLAELLARGVVVGDDAERLRSVVDRAREQGRSVDAESIGATMTGAGVSVDADRLDAFIVEILRERAHTRDAAHLDRLPDAGACDALCEQAASGWRGVTVGPDGTVTIRPAVTPLHTDCAPVTLYLDATADALHTRAMFGCDPDSRRMVRVDLAVGSDVVRHEGMRTHASDLLEREGRPNEAPFLRWLALHEAHRDGRTLHVVTSAVADEDTRTREALADLEAAGDAWIWHNGTEARGSNAYQECSTVILDGWRVPGAEINARADLIADATGCALDDARDAARFQLEGAPVIQAAHRVRANLQPRRIVYCSTMPLPGLAETAPAPDLDRWLYDAAGVVVPRAAGDLGAALIGEALQAGAVLWAGRDALTMRALAPYLTDPRPYRRSIYRAMRAEGCQGSQSDPARAALRGADDRDVRALAERTGGEATPVACSDGARRWLLHAPGVRLTRETVRDALSLGGCRSLQWVDVAGERLDLADTPLERTLRQIGPGVRLTVSTIARAAGVAERTVYRWKGDMTRADLEALHAHLARETTRPRRAPMTARRSARGAWLALIPERQCEPSPAPDDAEPAAARRRDRPPPPMVPPPWMRLRPLRHPAELAIMRG